MRRQRAGEESRGGAGTVAAILFLLLFPGLFAYHFMVAVRLVPLSVPAWWSTCNAIAAALLGPVVAWHVLRTRKWLAHVPLLILVTNVAITALYFLRFGEDWQRGWEPFLEAGKLVVGWSSLYCIGFFVRRTRWFTKALAWLFGCMALAAFLSIDPRSATFIAVYRFDGPVGVAGYQWFATGFVLVAIMALAFVRNSALQALMVGVSLMTLFVLSSRSELYGFSLVVVVWLLWKSVTKEFGAIGIMLVSAAAAFGLLFLYASILSSTSLNLVWWSAGRATEVLSLDKSFSWGFRMTALEGGLRDIKASPIFGVYAGQMRNDGEFGLYIHNALSAWRTYGVMAFLVYVGMSVAAPLVAVREVWRRRSDDPLWWATLYVGLFTLLLIAAAKSVFWPLPALAWGLLVGRRAGLRNLENDWRRKDG